MNNKNELLSTMKSTLVGFAILAPSLIIRDIEKNHLTLTFGEVANKLAGLGVILGIIIVAASLYVMLGAFKSISFNSKPKQRKLESAPRVQKPQAEQRVVRTPEVAPIYTEEPAVKAHPRVKPKPKVNMPKVDFSKVKMPKIDMGSMKEKVLDIFAPIEDDEDYEDTPKPIKIREKVHFTSLEENERTPLRSFEKDEFGLPIQDAPIMTQREQILMETADHGYGKLRRDENGYFY